MVAAEQLSLTGFAEEQKPTDRLFFALFPPADVAAAIASTAQRLKGELALKGRLLATERLHVTLHHLGDHIGLRHDIVAAAQDAASRVAVAPFDVCFDHVASFSARARNRPFVLLGEEPGMAVLKAFQRELGEALKRAALGRWAEGNFTPHVTLLYDDRAVASQPVEPVRWVAREFVLVHSLIGQTRHIVLGRWPLRAAAGR